jgi:hypothetical protein
MWLSRSILFLAVFALQTPSAEHVRSALEAAAKASPDGTDFAETAGYRELVSALIELKPSDVAAQQPAPLDAARALAEPNSQRGAWVSARGCVMLNHSIPLQTPVGALTKVERTFIKLERDKADRDKPDHDTWIVCDLIGDPPPYKSQADTIQVSGVFVRTVSYTSDNGKHVTLPYVLARSMELVDTRSSALAKSLLHGGPQLYTGVLLGALGVVVFVLYLRRSARAET